MKELMRKRKRRIFDIIQIGSFDDLPSRIFDHVLVVLILINLMLAIADTFDEMAPYSGMMSRIEGVTVVFFTVEYALRVWTAEFLYKDYSKVGAALRFVFSFYGIVDLLSFLPFYLPVFFPTGVVAFRMFRVVRILRLFRINAYYDALSVITNVLYKKRDQLMSSMFIILVLMISSSLCMYSLEHQAQPDVFENAFSGIWWSMSTLLTVGYGDIYPITLAGKVLGIIITFLGVGMVAIPTGIISAAFVEQYAMLKSVSNGTQELDIHFIRLDVDKKHPWRNMQVMDIPIPPGLILAVIQRGREIIVPHGDTVVREHDQIVMAAEAFQDDENIDLKEQTIKDEHPWLGEKIRDLDISRQTLIVMVRRNGKVLIPNGDLEFELNDIVLTFTRHTRRRSAVDVQTGVGMI